LIFILGTIVQYGITLHYAHLNAARVDKTTNSTIVSTRTDCVVSIFLLVS